MKAWKALEASAAALFNGKRFWANSGERLDFEGAILGHAVRGQCKLVKTLSLEALTKLAEEKDVDVVCVKVRRGKGKYSPMLVVFTEENLQRLFDTISWMATEAPCASSAPSPTLKPNENTSPLPGGPPHSLGPTLQESFLANLNWSRGPFKG